MLQTHPNTQAWTVSNYGRIFSTGSSGIDLKDDGLVSKPGTITAVNGFTAAALTG